MNNDTFTKNNTIAEIISVYSQDSKKIESNSLFWLILMDSNCDSFLYQVFHALRGIFLVLSIQVLRILM